MRAFLNLVASATKIAEGTKRTVSNNLSEHRDFFLYLAPQC